MVYQYLLIIQWGGILTSELRRQWNKKMKNPWKNEKKYFPLYLDTNSGPEGIFKNGARRWTLWWEHEVNISQIYMNSLQNTIGWNMIWRSYAASPTFVQLSEVAFCFGKSVPFVHWGNLLYPLPSFWPFFKVILACSEGISLNLVLNYETKLITNLYRVKNGE